MRLYEERMKKGKGTREMRIGEDEREEGRISSRRPSTWGTGSNNIREFNNQ